MIFIYLILSIFVEYREVTQEEGEYKFCVDNVASSFNSKTVFLEIYMYPEEDDEGGDDDLDKLDKDDEAEFDGHIEELKVISCSINK